MQIFSVCIMPPKFQPSHHNYYDSLYGYCIKSLYKSKNAFFMEPTCFPDSFGLCRNQQTKASVLTRVLDPDNQGRLG